MHNVQIHLMCQIEWSRSDQSKEEETCKRSLQAVRLTDRLGLAGPGNLYLPMLRYTVAEIEIDKALVRNPGIDRHAFEIGYYVFGEPHGDGCLELRRVGVPTRLHFGEIVFSFHGSSLPVKRAFTFGSLAGGNDADDVTCFPFAVSDEKQFCSRAHTQQQKTLFIR